MQSLRKSASEHCNFFTAAVRVMYAFAAPAFPLGFNLPILRLWIGNETGRKLSCLALFGSHHGSFNSNYNNYIRKKIQFHK